MIRLRNHHTLEYVVASGALAFDGKGWLWEKPLIAFGFIQPELFTVFIKSLSLEPMRGNLRWWKPWECVRPIDGGSVNKVGLTNPGIRHWHDKIAPKINFHVNKIAGSMYGERHELEEIATYFNSLPLVAVEVNVSCPNTGHDMNKAQIVIDSVKAVRQISIHPVIVKVSADQEFLQIAEGLHGVAEAISLNSVPWKTVFPKKTSPLYRLEERVGGGGGGVSGRPAQGQNWTAVMALAKKGALPVIAPSLMDYEDIRKVRGMGAKAVSFGAIHLPTYPVWRNPWSIFTNPCKPTRYVLRDIEDHGGYTGIDEHH